MFANHDAQLPRDAYLRATRRVAFTMLALLSLTGCAATVADSASTAVNTSSQAKQPITQEPTVTDIRITVADQSMTAQLADNPTAQNLADQLPLNLHFRDLNGVEKIAELPHSLTMDGVPAGADPDINDIGYYAPSGDLVFYYGDVGYWRE